MYISAFGISNSSVAYVVIVATAQVAQHTESIEEGCCYLVPGLMSDLSYMLDRRGMFKTVPYIPPAKSLLEQEVQEADFQPERADT